MRAPGGGVPPGAMGEEGLGTGALDVEGFARARERELRGLGRALGAAMESASLQPSSIKSPEHRTQAPDTLHALF